jgi:CRISPR-associated protein Csb2
MIAISFSFLAGRYHATPWDQHVNEGAVEWPPSAWRLLRGLVAASHKVAENELHLVQRTLEPLLTPPSYIVPPVGEGHTRHYMPVRATTTKVLDAFVAPGNGELIAIWPDADCDREQISMLDRLLDNLTYLGRSESWVSARRVDHVRGHPNCWPCPPEEANLWLSAVEDAARYSTWRDGFLTAQKAAPNRERRELPAGWWQILHQDTGRIRKDGWSKPPGLRRVAYRLEVEPAPALARRVRASARPTLARFEIRSSVLPRITEAVTIGDRARDSMLKISDGHPTFSGRVARGDDQLRSGHQHAFFLPCDDDGDGRIDHLTVLAREGFDDDARRALSALRKLWGLGDHDLHLTLTALVRTDDAHELGGVVGEASPLGLSPQLGPSHLWHSLTPFVPTRFIKYRGGVQVFSIEDDVRRLLDSQGFPSPRSVTGLSADHSPAKIAWHRFRRRRLKGSGASAGNAGYGLAIEFSEPVAGPIALGYGAHQGLGQMVAVRPSMPPSGNVAGKCDAGNT